MSVNHLTTIMRQLLKFGCLPVHKIW